MASQAPQAAIYARVSTGTDEQDKALHQQLARLRAAAAPDEPLEYVDVMSGTREDRPALGRLLEDCRAGRISRVLVTRLDRATRSVQEGARLVRYFSQPSSPQLLSLDDGLELRSVSGRFFAQILLAWAQAESERVSERTCHGKAHSRQQLKPLCPKAPYGYRVNGDRTNLEPDPAQWEQARYAIDWFLSHQTMRGLHKEMSQRLGHPWLSPGGIRAWLSNPTLYGARVYGIYQVWLGADGEKHRRIRPPGQFAEVHPDAHQALVTPVEYARILSILKANRDRTRRQLIGNYTRELTGLVHCGHCQRVMTYHWHRTKNQQVRLRCTYALCERGYRNHVLAETVTQAVIAALREHATELATVGHTSEMQYHQAIPEEAWELQARIQQLEALRDPDLAGVLQAKRLRLEALMIEAQPDRRCEFTLAQSMEALQQDSFWQAVQADPKALRAVFTDHLEQVIVVNCKVAEVKVRIPGC